MGRIYHYTFTDQDLNELGSIDLTAPYPYEIMGVSYQQGELTVYRRISTQYVVFTVINSKMEEVYERKIEVYPYHGVYLVPGGCVSASSVSSKIFYTSNKEGGKNWMIKSGKGYQKMRLHTATELYTVVSKKKYVNGNYSYDLFIIDNKTGESRLVIPDITEYYFGQFLDIKFSPDRISILMGVLKNEIIPDEGLSALVLSTYNWSGDKLTADSLHWYNQLTDSPLLKDIGELAEGTAATVEATIKADGSLIALVNFHKGTLGYGRYGNQFIMQTDDRLNVSALKYLEINEQQDENEKLKWHYQAFFLHVDDEITTTAFVLQRNAKANVFSDPPLETSIRIASFFEGDFYEDNLDTENESNSHLVFPAKPGYVMLETYFREEQRLERTLIKLTL